MDLDVDLFPDSWGITTLISVEAVQVCSPTKNGVFPLLYILTRIDCCLFYFYLFIYLLIFHSDWFKMKSKVGLICISLQIIWFTFDLHLIKDVEHFFSDYLPLVFPLLRTLPLFRSIPHFALSFVLLMPRFVMIVLYLFYILLLYLMFRWQNLFPFCRWPLCPNGSVLYHSWAFLLHVPFIICFS